MKQLVEKVFITEWDLKFIRTENNFLVITSYNSIVKTINLSLLSHFKVSDRDITFNTIKGIVKVKFNEDLSLDLEDDLWEKKEIQEDIKNSLEKIIYNIEIDKDDEYEEDSDFDHKNKCCCNCKCY